MQPIGFYQAPVVAIPKLLTVFYFLAALLVFVLVIVNLALERWVDYCFWYFGLIYATSWTDDHNLEGEENFNDVQGDVCDDSRDEDRLQRSCPHACRNISSMKSGGEAMLAFGILCLASLMLAASLHFILVLKKELKLRAVFIADALPTLLFIIGMIIYGSISNFSDFDSTTSEGGWRNTSLYERGWRHKTNPDNLKWEAGLNLAVANCVILPIFSVFSFYVSYKTMTIRQ